MNRLFLQLQQFRKWLDSVPEIDNATKALRVILSTQYQLAGSQARAFIFISPRATGLLVLYVALAFVLTQLGLAPALLQLSKWAPNIWWEGTVRLLFVAWAVYVAGFVAQTDLSHWTHLGGQSEEHKGNRGIFAVALVLLTMLIGWFSSLPHVLVVIMGFVDIAAFIVPNMSELARRLLVPIAQMIILISVLWILAIG